MPVNLEAWPAIPWLVVDCDNMRTTLGQKQHVAGVPMTRAAAGETATLQSRR